MGSIGLRRIAKPYFRLTRNYASFAMSDVYLLFCHWELTLAFPPPLQGPVGRVAEVKLRQTRCLLSLFMLDLLLLFCLWGLACLHAYLSVKGSK